MEDETAEPACEERGLGRAVPAQDRDHQVELLRQALQRLAITGAGNDATLSGPGRPFPRVQEADVTHMSIGDLESEVESAARDPSCDRGPGSLEDCNFPWFAVLVLNGPALALFTREGKSGRRHVDTDEVQRIFGPTVLRSVYRPGRRARMVQGVLAGASDPSLVLELPTELALIHLCRAVATLPALGPFRLRLRELDRDLIPNPELYPAERGRRCPGRVTLQNITAAGPTAAVAVAKRLVLQSLNRPTLPDEAEVFMVGGSASQRGGPGSRSWTVFLPLLDPAVAQKAVDGLHQQVVGRCTILAYGVGRLAQCALCGSRGHSQDECRIYTLLLFKRDGVPWTQPEIDGHSKGLQALRYKRGYGGEGPSSLLILLFNNERALISAVLSVVQLMRSGASHPYATAPRFTEGYCPRGCNRCLWPRTRANVHTAATCSEIRLLPAALPVRITVSPEGFAGIGKDGAAEPSSVPIHTLPARTGRSTAPASASPGATSGLSAPSNGENPVSAAPAHTGSGLLPPPVASAPPLLTHAPLPVPAPGSQPAPAVAHHSTPVLATGLQSAPAVAPPVTPTRVSKRMATPSSKGLELIADRADSASPSKAKRPLEYGLESRSEAGIADGRLVPLRKKQHTTNPSK